MLPVFSSNRAFVPVIAVFVLIVLWLPYSRLSVRPINYVGRKDPVNLGSFDGVWDYERDANNLLLSDAQCDAAFPSLFQEVDRAVEHRSHNHVTKKDLDNIKISNGYVRGMIYNQQLYIIEQHGTFFSREFATISAIQRALLTSPEPLPNIEFTFLTDDVVRPSPQWAYSRKTDDKELWLMPDFGFYSWPEPKIGAYHEVQRNAIAMDKKVSWRKKIQKAVWRGAVLGLAIRRTLLEVTKGKGWADVKTLDWGDQESFEHDRLSMDDHCKYKYVIHTEGTSNSGRLKYLQNCRSVVVVHKLEWVQHHHHLMVSSGPEQNMVEVERDFTDLEAKIGELKLRDEDAEAIADRGVKVFRERYLTPAAETCYWRKLIRGWATVSFSPEAINKTDGKWRGVPVESFLLMRTVEWGPTK